MIKKVLPIVRHPSLLWSYRHLFLVSHMRSRSTLLSHILGSSQNIAGYFEQHRSYKRYHDLLRLRRDLLKLSSRRCQYYLDKVLHDRLELADCVLEHRKCKFIFLLRSGTETINSILRMIADGHSEPRDDPLEYARSYYLQRCKRLVYYAERCGQSAMFVDSESLVSQPKVVLQKLSKWLGLASPLSETYDLFEHTGKVGFGDFSENISVGRIVDTSGSENFLSHEEQAASNKVFLATRSALSKLCHVSLLGNGCGE